jgi:hypothetical protein
MAISVAELGDSRLPGKHVERTFFLPAPDATLPERSRHGFDWLGRE